jgi:hypothetical protein
MKLLVVMHPKDDRRVVAINMTATTFEEERILSQLVAAIAAGDFKLEYPRNETEDCVMHCRFDPMIEVDDA